MAIARTWGTASVFTVTAYFSEGVASNESAVIAVTNRAYTSATGVQFVCGNYAYYVPFVGRQCTTELIDVLRAVGSGDVTVNFVADESASATYLTINIPFVITTRQDPRLTMRPQGGISIADNATNIPTYIIDNGDYDIEIDVATVDSAIDSLIVSRGDAEYKFSTVIDSLDSASLVIPSNSAMTYVIADKSYVIQNRDCDTEYIMLKWVGRWGSEKQHTFIVKSHEYASTKTALISEDGEYHSLRDVTVGCTIYMPQISSYDAYYYSDLLTANDVEACIDEANQYWVYASVEGKSLSINNLPTDLTFTLNYRHNDIY